MKVIFDHPALLEDALTTIRNKNTPSSQFRNAMKKLGRYLIYEASKDFETENVEITTPLETLVSPKLKHDIVIISVLRASLPMVDAIFEEFNNNASLGVVSASRGAMKKENGREFFIESNYSKIPDTKGKNVIIVDPMLATGSTIVYILETMMAQISEKPKQIFLISAIASKFGIDMIEKKFPNVSIYCGAIDEVLNDDGYIVPGLGDAGDRACNTNHP